jgi:hypothetical protein
MSLRVLPENAPRVFVVQFVSDAFVRQADELGERRVWPTGAARQHWNEATDRRPWVAIEGPQIDRVCRAECWTAHPQEPLPRLERTADRRREQHRHALGLPFIPRRDEAAGVPEHLCLGRAPCGRFLLAACRRRSSILRRLNPMTWISGSVSVWLS